MKRTSNSKCREFVQLREPFQASSLFAEERNGVYAVYSYGYHFPIFVYCEGNWYANSGRYSVSTSKHRSQAHPLENCIPLTTKELKELINQ
jgi:hypothetical protein